MPSPKSYGHEAAESGQRTDSTLAEVLGIDPVALADEVRSRIELIREAEREAERATAEVRLY